MSKPFNDTTNRTGLIQDCEKWTNLGRNTISGNEGLLADFAAFLNDALDELLPLIFASDAKWQFDDANHEDYPVATIDLEEGQADYSFTADEEGNSILDIYEVFVKDPQGVYVKLRAVNAQGDPNTASIFARNDDNLGTPTRYDKFATSIFLDPVPNYDMENGIRVVFTRTGSYFNADDTTKTPGIPAPFHRLLSLIASRDWLAVNKPEAPVYAEVKEQIRDRKVALSQHLSKRSKDEKTVMRPRVDSSR